MPTRQCRASSFRRGGAWTKVVIFVSLYLLLLQSLIESVVVLYLYGNKHIDSKMAPSLLFALTAVRLIPVIAWPSLISLLWAVGVSCALHRAVVIISVLAVLTVCLYFCSRELCKRPYDVSLLGVYSHQCSSRDGSILSASTLYSQKGLGHDILCVCRHSDVTYYRAPYRTPSDDGGSWESRPSIPQLAPIRSTSFLRFSPDQEAEAEYLSETIFSRRASTSTAQDRFQPQEQALPELPGANLRPQSIHTRNQSSFSSLRRFLPKSLPVSVPLSSDPQIRALAEATAHIDLGKQELQKDGPVSEEPKAVEPSSESISLPLKGNNQLPTTQDSENNISTSLPSSTTMNFAECPEIKHNTQTAPLLPTLKPKSNPTPSFWSTLPIHSQHNPLRMNSNTMGNPRRHSQNLSQNLFGPPHIPRYTQSQRFPDVQYQFQHRYQQRGLRRSRSSTFGNMKFAPVPGHLDCIRETGASINKLPMDDGRIPNRTQDN
ncbi:hypothetical protein BDW66DRAFT_161323 [Aspergillus desertorum]